MRLVKIQFLISVLLMCSLTGYNQNIKTYSGVYKGNNTHGEATYSYYENQEYERIYHGKFSYSGAQNRNPRVILKIEGSYIENKKNGAWSFYFTNPNKDYSFTLEGQYNNGNLNGNWVYSSSNKTIGYGKPDPDPKKNMETEKYSVNFDNNIFTGQFKYEHVFRGKLKESVDGNFNEDGLWDGEWIHRWENESYLNPVEGIYEFKDGVVQKYIIRNISTGEIIDKFNNEEFVELFFAAYDSGLGYSIIADEIYTIVNQENTKHFQYKPEGINYSFYEHIKYWRLSNEDFGNEIYLYEIPLGANSPDSSVGKKIYNLRITKLEMEKIISKETLNHIVEITKRSEEDRESEFISLFDKCESMNSRMIRLQWEKRNLYKAYSTLGEFIFHMPLFGSHSFMSEHSIDNLLKLYELHRILIIFNELANKDTNELEKKLENVTSPIKIKEIIYSN